MLDIKFVRDNPELVLQNLKNRNNPMNLDRFMELEKQRREIIAETENLKILSLPLYVPLLRK